MDAIEITRQVDQAHRERDSLDAHREDLRPRVTAALAGESDNDPDQLRALIREMAAALDVEDELSRRLFGLFGEMAKEKVRVSLALYDCEKAVA